MPSKSQSERSARPALVALGTHQSTLTGMISASSRNTRLLKPGVRQEAATIAFRATTGQAQGRVPGRARRLRPRTAIEASARAIPSDPQAEMGVRTQSALPPKAHDVPT